MQKANIATPIIEVSESKAGYFKVYDEVSSIPAESSFRVMIGKAALEQELDLLTHDQWNMFFTRIVERKIKTIGIFTKESLDAPAQKLSQENQHLLKQRAWDLSVIPESTLNVQQLMFIYENKVAFVFPETSLVMTITHQGIADLLASTFDALHSFGEKVEPTW